MRTVKEIEEEIRKLKAEEDLILKKENEKELEEAKKNVGRCFKIMDKESRCIAFARVIGIPENRSRTYVNTRQYPALFIKTKENKQGRPFSVPFYEDELFSAAWGHGYDTMRKYEEISWEEFNKEFKKKVNELEETIGNVSETIYWGIEE